MTAKLARGLITPNLSYVCLPCGLQTTSIARGRRFQHTGPPENHGGDTNTESSPKDAGNYDKAGSRSQIGNIIRSFMFRSDAEDKETNSDSRVESLETNKHSHYTPDRVSSIARQPKNNAVFLQQKFAAQRRKDMLAMQAIQASKAAEKNEEVSKASSVPKSTKLSTKKHYNRVERRRKLGREAIGKKPMKHPKITHIKPIEVSLDGDRESTTSTEPQTAEDPLPSIDVSASKYQETPGAEGKDTNDIDNKGSFPGEQTTTAQILKELTDLLDSSLNLKRSKSPKRPVTVAGKVKALSKNTKQRAALVATLTELQSSGERPGVKSRKEFNSQLPAYLNPNPEETPGSLHQKKVLHKMLSRKDDSLVSTITSLPPFMEAALENLSRKTASMPSFGKQLTKESNVSGKQPFDSGFVSLQSTLGPDAGKVKGAGPKSPKFLSSDKFKRVRVSPKEKARKSKAPPKSIIEKTTALDLEILPLKVDQPPVPSLAHGLERVLFNPGVYQLQDPRSRVYNFEPYLQKIMPIAEFDFSALNEYITSSRDQSLVKIAKEHGKRYMGSTSSMTEVLAHFHFLLSQWRPINPSMLSKAFPAYLTTFTAIQRIPSAIFLRWKDGSYAIDADKQFASANVLSMLGKSMEKLLTLNTDDFERYRKSNPGPVTEDEQLAPESYHYSTMGDFLMRSQLDAHDPRLPGTGMFDLKTRSVVSIRMDVSNYQHGVGYEIKTRQGEWESYEREYHDMIRAAFLKYSLQVRMGRMDGIFVAFHNIERIFGFQYISLPEMDSTLHGQWDTALGDQEFRLSLDLMNKVLDRATKKYPETSLRIHFETRDVQTAFMYIFVEPVTEEEVEEIQSQNSAKIQEFERNILGLTRGNHSETDDIQEHDSKWENIQADVQEAMDKDELSIDETGQEQEVFGGVTEETGSAVDRPEVLEQGPLYAIRSSLGVDDGVTAASAGSEEDDCESEDDDDVDIEEERGDEEEEEEGGDRNRDPNGDGDIEESRQQEGLEEFLEDEVDVKANDTDEGNREVRGDDTEVNDTTPIKGHPVDIQNEAIMLKEEHNKDHTAGAISAQESADGATESTNSKDDTSISPDAKPGSIADEQGQQEYQTEADQGFLNSIDQEAQADTIAKKNSKDILAMTLTLRNKVNGKYVLRPDKMTAADEWSIEYSLIEVPEQTRARALYEACQMRRSKKLEDLLISEDAEVISGYVQKLRKMSEMGRAWRKEQDKIDRKRPVQVL